RTSGFAGGLSRRTSSRSPSNGFGSWFSSGPSPGPSPPRGGSGSSSSSRSRGFGSQGSPRSRSSRRSSPTVRGLRGRSEATQRPSDPAIAHLQTPNIGCAAELIHITELAGLQAELARREQLASLTVLPASLSLVARSVDR